MALLVLDVDGANSLVMGTEEGHADVWKAKVGLLWAAGVLAAERVTESSQGVNTSVYAHTCIRM